MWSDFLCLADVARSSLAGPSLDGVVRSLRRRESEPGGMKGAAEADGGGKLAIVTVAVVSPASLVLVHGGIGSALMLFSNFPVRRIVPRSPSRPKDPSPNPSPFCLFCRFVPSTFAGRRSSLFAFAGERKTLARTAHGEPKQILRTKRKDEAEGRRWV